tara:strand:+ start:680 stop:1528 length:849 start_codon:yes stop_codon:yes gene_type:complete
MIIWLASYPKSGNTWIRIFISNIINSKKNDYNDPFRFLDDIAAYPNIRQYSGLVKDNYNVNEIVPNWIRSQDIINLKKGIKIFKTHNMLGSFGKYNFTDLNNTAGVIYIVRDPRNVVTSLKNHFELDSIKTAEKFILAKNNWLYASKNKNSGVLPNFCSSWNMHYLSWKSFPKNYLLIKYEDLIKNPMNEIVKIYNYLKKFYDLSLKNEDLIKIVNFSSFEKLKKKENEEGFDESLEDKERNKKIPFFNSGPSNDWKKDLDESVRYEIEKEFSKEMRELGYL